MEIIDNISRSLGDDLKRSLKPGAKLKVAASCFSMYAYEALKAELEQIEELDFIFTSPTFLPDEVTDRIRKERREFHIPKLDRERSLYGSEFEIQADLVLLAMGFVGPERGALVNDLGLKMTERGNVWRDERWMTSVPGVFAAGDMQRGQSLIVWAIAEGRSAARGVDQYLMGESALPAPLQ